MPRFGQVALVACVILASLAAQGAVAQAEVSTPFETDVNRPGSDYQNFDIASPQECQQTCLGDNQCVAWTDVKPGLQGPQARCWLKNAVPTPTGSNCCVSGIKDSQNRDLPSTPATRRTSTAYPPTEENVEVVTRQPRGPDVVVVPGQQPRGPYVNVVTRPPRGPYINVVTRPPRGPDVIRPPRGPRGPYVNVVTRPPRGPDVIRPLRGPRGPYVNVVTRTPRGPHINIRTRQVSRTSFRGPSRMSFRSPSRMVHRSSIPHGRRR